jgi:hypothetical protein
VRWLKRDIGEATLRALLTSNGGDDAGTDW